MIRERLIRMSCILVAVCILLGAPAFASEEPSESGEPAAEALLPELGESADEALSPETEEPADEEPPVPEEEDGDPMALRLAMALDGGSKTWSDFTTRSLDNETLRKGVDVSAYQASINWKDAAADGVEFAIIRAAYRTYGSGVLYKDSYFEANVRGARAAGIKVGVYIFSQAITEKEAVEEADYLISLVEKFDIDLPLVFDFEYVSGGRLKSSLGKRVSTDICLAFCERVEEAGYDSMVYANASTLSGNLYPTEFSRVWLAHYTSRTGYSASDYEYWQCSDSGGVSGISGNVDMDFRFEPNKSEIPFTDVREGDWFYDSVCQAYKSGVVSGMTENTFGPGGTATRGQFAAMLHRMKGEPDWSVPAVFEDLTQEYYRDAVFWAAENGIVSGYSETSFRPDRAITREELVSILYRMEGEPETEGGLDGFSDADRVQRYARDAMAWAVENGVVSGYEDGTLRPRNNATRAEVCTLLMGYRDMGNDEP